MPKLTARPEPAVAATEYVPPTRALAGAVEVNEIVCGDLAAALTAKLCCFCGAACQLPFPAWSARTTQVPAPSKLTVEPPSEQTPALAAAMLKLTGRPALAVALTA